MFFNSHFMQIRTKMKQRKIMRFGLFYVCDLVKMRFVKYPITFLSKETFSLQGKILF